MKTRQGRVLTPKGSALFLSGRITRRPAAAPGNLYRAVALSLLRVSLCVEREFSNAQYNIGYPFWSWDHHIVADALSRPCRGQGLRRIRRSQGRRLRGSACDGPHGRHARCSYWTARLGRRRCDRGTTRLGPSGLGRWLAWWLGRRLGMGLANRRWYRDRCCFGRSLGLGRRQLHVLERLGLGERLRWLRALWLWLWLGLVITA